MVTHTLFVVLALEAYKNRIIPLLVENGITVSPTKLSGNQITTGGSAHPHSYVMIVSLGSTPPEGQGVGWVRDQVIALLKKAEITYHFLLVQDGPGAWSYGYLAPIPAPAPAPVSPTKTPPSDTPVPEAYRHIEED